MEGVLKKLQEENEGEILGETTVVATAGMYAEVQEFLKEHQEGFREESNGEFVEESLDKTSARTMDEFLVESMAASSQRRWKMERNFSMKHF